MKTVLDKEYELGLRTRSAVPKQLKCPKCNKLINVRKHGVIVNIYQKCDICAKILGVPSDAKTNDMTEIRCAHCGAKNAIKLDQRWLCDNKHTFTAK